VADRAAIAVLVNIAARFDDCADETVVDEFHVANQRRIRTILCSMLHDAFVLLGCGDELASFVSAVSHRLFDVNIFAGLAGPNRGERMPVIRCGDSDGIDGFVLKRFADVFVAFGALPCAFSTVLMPCRARLSQHRREPHTRRHPHAENVFDMAAALAMESDGADPIRLLAPKTFPCAIAPATITAVAVLPRNCRRVRGVCEVGCIWI